MKKINKKIIIFSLVLLLAVVGLVSTTVAWLTSTGSKQHTFVMGEVVYEFGSSDSAAANKKIVVPGEDIFNGITISLTNKSTVETQVRLKIDVVDNGTAQAEIKPGNPVELSTIFTVGFGASADWLAPSAADGYYYYCVHTGDQSDPTKGKVAVATTTGSLGVPLEMTFDGAKVGNTYMGKNYTITITFQVKQLDNVNWSDMGGIDFTTGLAPAPAPMA